MVFTLRFRHSNVRINYVLVLPTQRKTTHQKASKTTFGTQISENFWEGVQPLFRPLTSGDGIPIQVVS